MPMTPPVYPIAAATAPRLVAIEFYAWVGQARPGDRLTYHRGFLGIDTAPVFSLLSEPDRERLMCLAAAALDACERGLVHLVQERLGPDRFAYIAVARPRPPDATPSMAVLPPPEPIDPHQPFYANPNRYGEPAHALA